MAAVRLGFVGVGYITINSHLPALKPLVDSGDVVLQAFCDVDEEALTQQAGAFGVSATYTDHLTMYDAEDLDAVYICLPPTMHTDQVPAAAEKGLHLFVEKPQTLDMAQAMEHAAAVAEAGVVSQIGFQSRYYPASEFVRQRLQELTPRHASVQLFYGGKPVRWWTSRYEECGGSFVENTVHMVDLLRYFLGDIEQVSAFYQWRQPGEGPEPMNMPHVYGVNYRFGNGVVANATTSRVLTNAPVSRREVLIISDDSLIEWSAQKVVENGETVWEAGEDNNASAHQARAFVEAVRAADPSLPRSPYGSSNNSLAAVLGANASAEKGGQLLDLADVAAGKVSWLGQLPT